MQTLLNIADPKMKMFLKFADPIMQTHFTICIIGAKMMSNPIMQTPLKIADPIMQMPSKIVDPIMQTPFSICIIGEKMVSDPIMQMPLKIADPIMQMFKSQTLQCRFVRLQTL